MSISLECSCGATIEVDAKNRGKKTKCPECGKVLRVEEAETGVQSEPPRKRSAAADNDDEDSPRPTKRGKPVERNMMPLMIGGGSPSSPF